MIENGFEVIAKVYKGKKQVGVIQLEYANGYLKAFVLKSWRDNLVCGSGKYTPLLEIIHETMPEKWGYYGYQHKPAEYNVVMLDGLKLNWNKLQSEIKYNWSKARFAGDNWYERELMS